VLSLFVLRVVPQVDVVMITEDANPPVVRLIAFSKYKYELEKTAKQKQKASKG
jgi:translation initiation factor IF-3